jgi:hypothetical protein
MSRKQRQPDPPFVLNLRQRSRVLFPEWTTHMRAQWVLSKMRVAKGRWSMPIGERHSATEIPNFLRTLPPGPPLEIKEDAFDKRVKSGRFVARLVGGRK